MVKEIQFKEGVRFKRWSRALAKMLSILSLVQNRYEWTPEIITVTSVNDGQHMVGSKHYIDEAIDIRSKNFTDPTDKLMFISVLREELGGQFTVIFEHQNTDNEHFHVQVRKGIVFV